MRRWLIKILGGHTTEEIKTEKLKTQADVVQDLLFYLVCDTETFTDNIKRLKEETYDVCPYSKKFLDSKLKYITDKFIK